MKAVVGIYSLAFILAIMNVLYVNMAIDEAVRTKAPETSLTALYSTDGLQVQPVSESDETAPILVNGIQGDQENSDNLQPAMGYNALNWNIQ